MPVLKPPWQNQILLSLPAIFRTPKRDALETHSDCRDGEVNASLIRSAASLGRKQYGTKIREEDD
jgi:hypothetical protein